MKLKEITPGQLLNSLRRKYKLKGKELARLAGCSTAMICMIQKDQRSPSFDLSRRIVEQFPIGEVQREQLSWFLTKQHRKLEKLQHDYPNTFEDIRSTWIRKDKNRT